MHINGIIRDVDRFLPQQSDERPNRYRQQKRQQRRHRLRRELTHAERSSIMESRDERSQQSTMTTTLNSFCAILTTATTTTTSPTAANRRNEERKENPLLHQLPVSHSRGCSENSARKLVKSSAFRPENNLDSSFSSRLNPRSTMHSHSWTVPSHRRTTASSHRPNRILSPILSPIFPPAIFIFFAFIGLLSHAANGNYRWTF